MSDAGRVYVAAVCAAGICIVLHSLSQLTTATIGYQWFVLAGLTLLSGSFTIRIPTIPARLSVSETFVFAAAILFGPAAATIIVVLDSLIISFWLRKSSRRLSRVLFNMAAPAIAIWVATHVFFLKADVPPLYQSPRPILTLVFPLLILAILYFLLNSWLIAGAVGFEKRRSAFKIWRENFMWLSLNYFSGASVAALLLPYLRDDQQAWVRVASILLPLLLISYLTFKTALGRVDDANQHLAELNRLYLSTIETLAMAIDAKDQITHGHIRRVQQYAVGLATRMGITEVAQIKAIEAASLLHDMGKLAVPEYILNKPGKLTPAEFEKMKLHASVGADILSAIEFPYPVVPIVRHHHENWDGTGYPDGLSGSDIPVGARILSVVDCFDALTSDRPYRPRLPTGDAIKILEERRGSMYDPLVVDKFIETHLELTPQSDEDRRVITVAGADVHSSEISTDGVTALDDIASSSEEMVILFDLVRSLTAAVTPADVGEIVAQNIRRIVPASSCVLYLYNPTIDELIAASATGEHADHFSGIRIPRGERLTGWVAANRQTIANSDPVLDLGEIARNLRPRLRSCLSTPIAQDDALVGVLSLYGTESQAFNENHRRIAELIARQIAPSLRIQRRQEDSAKTSARVSRSSNEDSRVVDSEEQGNLSIAVIDVGIPSLVRAHGAEQGSLARIAAIIKASLRGADVLFHHQHDELIALLGGADVDAASQVVRRIADRMHDLGTDTDLRNIRIGIASTPMDGLSIDSLIAAAKLRREPLTSLAGRRSSSIH